MKKSKIPYVLSWVFNILYMGYSFLVIFNIVFFCCSDSVYFDPHYPFQASQIWEAFLFLVGVSVVTPGTIWIKDNYGNEETSGEEDFIKFVMNEYEKVGYHD